MRINSQKLFLSIIFFIFCFGFLGAFKHSLQQPQTVYVTLKLGQGYWWINTPNPPIPLIESLKPNSQAKDLLGHTIATINQVQTFPTLKDGKIINNVYVQLKLKVTQRNQSYYFDRNKVKIGEPITIEFPNLSLTGSVISLTQTKPKTNLQTFKIKLIKQLSFPEEFEQIKIGDSFIQNQNTLFTITHKSCKPTHHIARDSYGNVTPNTIIDLCFLELEGLIQLTPSSLGYVFGQETIVKPGSLITLSTNNSYLINYIVTSLQQQPSQTKE